MLKKLQQIFLKYFFSSSSIGEETKKGLKMKNEIDEFIEENTQELNQPLIFDIDLMPYVKKANEGDVESIQKLAYAFSNGNQTKVNLDLAVKYFELLFDSLPEYQYLARHYIQYNLATIEARRGDYEELKLRFYNLVKQMYKEVPMEEWRFETFDWMRECIEWKKNQDEEV